MKTVEHLPRAHYAAVMLPTITSARASATPSSSLGKRRAMTSSERGIKFRKKQRERSAMLERSTATLRAELSRLQALRDVWQSASFAPTRGGTPVQFAREFFAQFRDGVFRVGDRQRLRQEEFLSAMAEPGALLDGESLARALLHSLERESELYPTLRVDLESTEALTADGCAVVVCKGCKRLRYSRRAIEVLYPHASRDEQLVRKLVGRQLRVPFLTKLFFGEKGRLTGIETDDQVAGALYDVLRDLGDCAAVLGPAPVDAWRLCCKGQHQERHLP